ncbi:MAG: response regulator [Methylococcaceae bacterium]|nr:response regulator [Methylococcaceae bacterium]
MKCLVVDDSKMSRMMLKKIINTAYPDWTIIEACDGQDAIEKAKGQGLDLILLDYNMPVMGGGEAAKVLRPQFPSAKMAFLTANVQEAIKKLAIRLKVDFISKPITEEKILKYVR